jgi:hypothetical protein
LTGTLTFSWFFITTIVKSKCSNLLFFPPEGTDSSVVKIETDIPETGEVAGGNKEPLVIEGLDSGTVVGIAFAAFIIGAMMMGALWFIHTHSGKCKSYLSCLIYLQ